MTYVSEARVATPHAARYAAQTAKHWAHNLAVEERDQTRVITFPAGARGADWPGAATVTLAPEGDCLVCRIEASAEGQRDGLKGAVERHVDRFAFREAPLPFSWADGEVGSMGSTTVAERGH